MARFYFNLRNGEVTDDYEGADLPNADAARDHGIRAARSIAAESVQSGFFTRSHFIEVVDAERHLIATIRFDEAVEVRP